MTEKNVRINIENIHVENLFITKDALDFFDGKNIKIRDLNNIGVLNDKNDRQILNSEDKNINLCNEHEIKNNSEMLYAKPKKINSKRNFNTGD